jgi:PBP1b-binding outer membrane lipoprotein LpoB
MKSFDIRLGSALLAGLLLGACAGETAAPDDEVYEELPDEELDVPSQEALDAEAEAAIDESNADDEFERLKDEIGED